MDKTYRPTLVIGLGGTGKGIALSLKKMIAENSQYGMSDFPFLKILSIDTDTHAESSNSAIMTITDDQLSLNPAREVLQLKTGFTVAPTFADYPSIEEWFPQSLKSNLLGSSFSTGAGQIKPLGRFAFAWNASEIKDAISSFIASPVSALEARNRNIANNLKQRINVFICGSLCGGTGAGTFLDVAYLVRSLATASNGNGYNVDIYGIFALASMFDGGGGKANIKTNCYASLVELDHFMNGVNYKNPNRVFHIAHKNDDSDMAMSCIDYPPFKHMFLFDNIGERVSIGIDAFHEMAARFINLLISNEIADSWDSMDDNVTKNLEKNYKRDIYNKDVSYRGMGTYSILYPKRQVIQLRSLNLIKDYLDFMVQDSYSPQEIEGLCELFLNESRFNPNNDMLTDSFFKYRKVGEENSQSFADAIEDIIDGFSLDEIKAGECYQRFVDMKDALQAELNIFRQQNGSKARDIRKEFLAVLEKELQTLLDLHERAYGIKKTSAGENIKERGSLMRACNFLKALLRSFERALDNEKQKQKDKDSKIKECETELDVALDNVRDIENRGFLITKNKLNKGKAAVVNAMRNFFITKGEFYVISWTKELFTDIKENDVPKYDGLIKEVSSIVHKYESILHEFSVLSDKVGRYLTDNKKFEESGFFVCLFDYERDVAKPYKEEIDKEGERIFGGLSDKLMSGDLFGGDYLRAYDRHSETLRVNLLNACEPFFFDKVNDECISEKILQSEKVCGGLRRGTYYGLAPVYLGINSMVISKVGLNLEANTFFAVSIPNEYEGKYCADIKGIIKDEVCPMVKDKEKYEKDPCPLFGRCIKQMLLENIEYNIAIIPTNEMAEINFVKTVAGYPLCAISSVMNGCKQSYKKDKEDMLQHNINSNRNEETINMFGNVVFPDLDEKTIDPSSRAETTRFRKDLLLAYVARRLVIQKFSVDFITIRDIEMNRVESPSISFGNSIADAYKIFQSTKANDIATIDIFSKEVENIRQSLHDDEAARQKCSDYFADLYKKELPCSFCENSDNSEDEKRTQDRDRQEQDDKDLLAELAKELCGLELRQKVVTSPIL